MNAHRKQQRQGKILRRESTLWFWAEIMSGSRDPWIETLSSPLNGRLIFGLFHLSQKRPYHFVSEIFFFNLRRWLQTYHYDEHIDHLCGVSFDVENEWVDDAWRRRDDNNDLCDIVKLLNADFYYQVRLTDGIRWMMSPGSGDFPVGQLDAQNRLPNGSGTPSFASSWLTRDAA